MSKDFKKGFKPKPVQLAWKIKNDDGSYAWKDLNDLTDDHLQNTLMFLGRTNPGEFINGVRIDNYIVAIVRIQSKRNHQKWVERKQEEEGQQIVDQLKEMFPNSQFLEEKEVK